MLKKKRMESKCMIVNKEEERHNHPNNVNMQKDDGLYKSLDIKFISCIEILKTVRTNRTSSSTLFAYVSTFHVMSFHVMSSLLLPSLNIPFEHGARPLNRWTYQENGLQFNCFFNAKRSEISPMSIFGFPLASSLILADL